MARLTVACTSPGTRNGPFSTRFALAAQVMPVICRFASFASDGFISDIFPAFVLCSIFHPPLPVTSMASDDRIPLLLNRILDLLQAQAGVVILHLHSPAFQVDLPFRP